MPERYDRWRRTRRAAAVGAAVLLGLTPFSLPGNGVGAAEEPGQGLAFAQALKVDPKAGGLSVGLAFGQATANHQNQVAKAISTGTHMGVVGTTLAARQCNDSNPTLPREQQPQTLIVDSRDEGAATGKPHKDQGYGEMFPKWGKATDAPFAEARAWVAAGPTPEPTSGFQMGKTMSRASSGLDNGQREARATVDIDYINLKGTAGTVTRELRLSNLRWDATYRSTGDKKVEGRFTIGSAVLDGQQQNTQNPSIVLNNANSALKEVGIKLVPGAVRTVGDMVVVDPLAVVVVPHADRDQHAARVMHETRNIRRDLFDAILKADCRAGTYISVFDIVVGSLTGAGEFVLSLGGVQASSGTIPKNQFNLELGQPGMLPSFELPPSESSFTGTPAVGGGDFATLSQIVGGSPAVPTLAMPPAVHQTQLATTTDGPVPEPFKGTRGGALAVVGLVTLAAVGLAAEADRRMMRRALQQAAAAEAGE